jgi:hypothetical protein
MKTKRFGLTFLGVAGVACLCLAVGCAVFLSDGRAGITVVAGSDPALAENVRPHADGDVRLAEGYGKLPLSFEVNKGQAANEVKFLSRGGGYTLFLTGNEAVLSLRKPGQKANGKRQMANVAQRSPLNAAALRVAPRSLFNAAAFPEVFRFPAAENDSRAADPNTGSALRGLRDEARIPEPRIPNPDRPAHEPGRCQPAGEGQWP